MLVEELHTILLQNKKFTTAFKSLGHPIRLLIIIRMLNGAAYTREELYRFVSRIITNVTETSVDRHVRTLHKYGVIRPYHRIKRNERGRRPIAYVIRNEFRDLFEIIINDIINLSLGSNLKKYLVEIALELLHPMILNFKNLLYLSPELDNEVVTKLKQRLKKVSAEIGLYALTVAPIRLTNDCNTSYEILKTLESNEILTNSISAHKVVEILITALINSELRWDIINDITNALGINEVKYSKDFYKDINPTNIIKQLLRKCDCSSRCSDVLTSFTNDLVLLFKSVWAD